MLPRTNFGVTHFAQSPKRPLYLEAALSWDAMHPPLSPSHWEQPLPSLAMNPSEHHPHPHPPTPHPLSQSHTSHADPHDPSHSHSSRGTTENIRMQDGRHRPSSSVGIIPQTIHKNPFCYRHRPDILRPSDAPKQESMRKHINALSSTSQTTIMQIWSAYTSMPPCDRRVLLEGLLFQSCVPQLSYISTELNTYLRIDFIAVAPKEIALKILTHLDATSLCHAAQVSRAWKRIADDDVIWHRMCEQHIDRKCPTCGWGLPLLDFNKYRKRRISLANGGGGGDAAETCAGSSSASHMHVDFPLVGGGSGVGAHPSIPRAHLDNGSGSTPTSTDGATEYSQNKRRRLNADVAVDAGQRSPVRRVFDDALPATATSSSTVLSPTSASPSPIPIPTPTAPTGDVTAFHSRVAHGTISSLRGSSAPPSSQLGASPSSLSSTSTTSDSVPPFPSVSSSHCTYLRAWKEIYAERLLVERNWRGGNFQFHAHSVYGAASAAGADAGDGTPALEPVLAVQLDECQNVIAIGGHSDGAVRLFTPGQSVPFLVLRGHTAPVRALKFDNAKLVSGSADGTIRIWRHRTPRGELAKILRGHGGPVTCLDFDERVLVSGGGDMNIRVWNFSTGKGFVLQGHTDWINGVKLAGNYVFSASDDHTVRMWDLEKKACVRVMSEHVAPVQCVKVNPDNSNLGKGKGADNASSNNGPADPTSMSLTSSLSAKSGSGRQMRVLSCSLDNTIKIWDPFTGKCLNTMFGHMEGVWCVAFDTLRIVSGAQDGKVEIWDTETGNSLHTLSADGSRRPGFGGRIMVRGSSGDQRAAAIRELEADEDDDEPGGHISMTGGNHHHAHVATSNLAAIGLQVPAAHALGQPPLQRSRCAITAVQLTDTKIIAGGSDGVVRSWDFGITLNLGIGLGKQEGEVEWEGRRSPERVESVGGVLVL
ncbi:WD40 repeat-like protein [Gonapodya prolifera JEL478]|uniref:WD40 repeat-like protein n=1 Tax=Gonapodya prolifera (strain JEL478) TaxID=1344416 RepID=A0A139ALT0_GONPJ|nr:WD40 repeat-like protein [Gonapodya prolifera JEL478]|eukprot:KXS17742.1 WD40 repeat-like protein [Gonapodya prolifera JEL478]